MRAVASGVIAGVLAALTLVAEAQPAPSPRPASPGAGPVPGDAAPPAPAVEPSPQPGDPAPGTVPAAEGGSAPPPPPRELGRHRGPWLLVGGSIALVTVGAVLAYSANAAERDVEDLYVGLSGTPPPFNATTRRLYDDAVAEGRRYQTLSIVSFSLAGALAAGAAVWFALDRGERITVTPAAAPGTAGVSTTIRF